MHDGTFFLMWSNVLLNGLFQFLHLFSAAKSWDQPDKHIDIEAMTDVVRTTLYQMKEAQPARYAALAIRFEWSVLYLHLSVGKCSCHSSKALGFDRHATQPSRSHDLTVEDRNSDGEDSDSYGPSDFDVIMQNLMQSSDTTTSSYKTPSGEEGAPELDGDEEHGMSHVLV
jgi:hypothetical protein